MLSMPWRSSDPVSKAHVRVELLRDFERLLDERCAHKLELMAVNVCQTLGRGSSLGAPY